MASTTLASQNFNLGMRQDEPREQLPRGAAYRLTDYIPRDGAVLRKRGGWGMATRDLNALAASARLAALAWAPFSSPHLIMVSDTHQLFSTVGTAVDSAAGSLVGDVLVTPTYPPFWHRDRMILLQGIGAPQADPMKYYDAGAGAYTLGAVGGTPPRARVGWSWGDYLILANGYDPSSAYALRNNRLWVSGVGNPDSWNTTASGGIFDMPDEVVGGVSMRNFQVVFGYSRVWAIAGDTPPPGSNWSRRDLFSVGCMDGRSIATYGDYFIWANNSGIYRSDGATTPTDVTAACGLSLFWRSLVSSFNFGTGWKAVAGVLYGCYVISITNAAGANVATLVFDLEKDVAFTLGNVYAGMFAQRYPGPGTSLEAGTEELFAAWNSGPRAFRLSQLWTPTSLNALDGDGTPVLPSLETPFYLVGSTDRKTVRRVYLGYDLRTAGGTPTLATGYVTSPESTSYTEIATSAFPATTSFQRKRRNVNKSAVNGIAFRFRQTAASADTRIEEIELEGHAWETSR
jgi:hypothetical protein